MGRPIDYLGALPVAGDEAVFHAFSAADESPVATVSQRAGLRYARIVESVAVTVPGLADALSRLLDGTPGTGSQTAPNRARVTPDP